MIQQPIAVESAVSVDNGIKTKFIQLYQNQSTKLEEIKQFIANLYEFQYHQSDVGILDQLVKCLFEQLTKGQLKDKRQIAIQQTIAVMIQQTKQSKYIVGILQIGQILAHGQIRQLIRNILALDNHEEQSKKNLQNAMKMLMNKQAIEELSQSSQNINVLLGRTQVLIDIPIYLMIVSKYEEIEKIIESITKQLLSFIKQQSRNATKQQLDIFFRYCLSFENVYNQLTQAIHGHGYWLAIDCVIEILKYGNLEKKFNVLANLEQLINFVKRNQIRLEYRFGELIGLILQPRNHEEILNRSIYFLKFWFQRTQISIKSQLKHWLINLIMKADTWTNNVYGKGFNKFIQQIENVEPLPVSQIYDLAIEILKGQQLDNPIEVNKKLSKQQSIKQQQSKLSKLSKILSPLINKQFKPFEVHQKNTQKFLSQVWRIKSKLNKNLKKIINENLMNTILELISPNFNQFVLEATLDKIINIGREIQKKMKNGDKVVIHVSMMYHVVHAFLVALNKFDNQQQNHVVINELFYFDKKVKQLGSIGISILIRDEVLGNLIICHDSKDDNQLQLLLELIGMIMQRLNQPQFENRYLCILVSRVKLDNQFFLGWLKNRLERTNNIDILRSIGSYLFKTNNRYSDITLSGLTNLLYISSISDLNKQAKQQFCLSLLKQVPEKIVQQSINLILLFLWNQYQISQQKWLQVIINKMIKLKMKSQLFLKICMQIIVISEEKGSDIGQTIFSQETAMREQINIQITIIHEKYLTKKIKYWDSVSLLKIKKKQIEPMLNSEPFSQLAIQSIYLDNREFRKGQMVSSLRYLGFRTECVNRVFVRIKLKTELMVRDIKDWDLYGRLSNWYRNQNSQNVFQFCMRNQLKYLKQQIEKQAKKLKFNTQSLTKQNFLIILRIIISKILQYKYIGRQAQKIQNELIQLLSLFDKKSENTSQYSGGSSNHEYSQRKFMSYIEYMISCGNSLLKLRQIEEINNSNNHNLFYCQQIGYEFISLLITEPIINYESCNINTYIEQNLHELPYTILYGLQIIWILIKQAQKMQKFIQSQIPTKIFSLIKKSMNIVQQKKQRKINMQVYFKIIGTGIKIINIITKLLLVQDKKQQVSLIGRKPSYLFELKQTKNNIQEINNNEVRQQIIENDLEIIFIKKVLSFNNQKCNCVFKLNQLMDFFKAMCRIVEVVKLESDSLLVFYQISKINCWIINFLEKDKQKSMIAFLVTKLYSKCNKLSLACSSILYIYLKLNSGNCTIILQYLRQTFKQGSSNWNQYFSIYNQCFKQCTNPQIIEKTKQQFFVLLINLPPQQLEHEQNYLLQGIIKIISQNINKINKIQCKQFVELLFNSCLFYFGNERIKTVHRRSRLIVYEGILMCLKYLEDVDVVNKYIDDVKKQITLASSTSMNMKEIGMGVGLDNLGNICYLNAQMQLLHSIKKFVEEVQKIQTDFPLLLGMQQLFLNMTYSLQKSISPDQFINSFDPPIDIRLQQDTSQFFTQFLQKLSSSDKSQKFKKLIQNLFTGKTQSKITCSSCKNNKKFIQDNFILYQVALKSQEIVFSDLEESIENNKKLEMLYDVNCQYCKEKRMFSKETVIKSIPKYLFIHLRRLIFDYKQPNIKIKIHTQLKFPQILTLKNQILNLKSVITHSGTGQYGHYITSVKQNQKWLVYNDAKVSFMSSNGKQELWYGAENNFGESTNAYVLLYEKVNLYENNTQMMNNQMMMPNLKEIKEKNQKLMLKYLLFDEQYQRDFLQFAHGLVLLPQTPQKMIKIYQLLALISYHSGLAPSKPASQYFQVFSDHESPQKLISLIYSYKQYNNIFIFHKSKQLRQFFCTYLQNVFKICLSSCNQALVYSTQLLKLYQEYLIEDKNFIYCNEFLKLISYLFEKLKTRDEFIKVFYELKIVEFSYQVFKSKKLQIRLRYQNYNIQLMESLLLLSCNLIRWRNGQYGEVLYGNLLKKCIQYMGNCISGDMDYVELMFIFNSKKDYSIMLLELLQLNKNNKFIDKMTGLVVQTVSDWKMLDGKTSRNLCDMIWYVFDQLHLIDKEKKQTVFKTVFGYAFPYYSINNRVQFDARVESLKERSYYYLTNKLNSSLIQIITTIICDILKQQKISIQNLQILQNFLKLKMKFLQDNSMCSIYVNYMSNLPSPIALFGHYLQFEANAIQQIINKIHSDVSMSDMNNALQYLQNYKYRIVTFQNEIVQTEQDEIILCGAPTNIVKLVSQKSIYDQLYVRVQDYQYHWCNHQNNKGIFIKFVDYVDYRLNPEHHQDVKIIRLIKPVKSNQIDEEGQFNRTSEGNNVMQLDIQQYPQLQTSIIRRKFIFLNINYEQLSMVIRIEGKNMKNNFIQLSIELVSHQEQWIWIQKKKMSQSWGEIKISINQLEIDLFGNQEMMNQIDNQNNIM